MSAEVIKKRGLIAVGHTVNENACGDVLTGIIDIGESS